MGILQTAIVQRTNPLTGDTRLYPGIVTYSRIDSEQVIDAMCQNSNISRSTAVAAMYAFQSIIRNYVLNGHTVKIPQLGTFSLNAKAKAQATVDKVTPNTIKGLKIRFTPISRVKTSAQSVKFAGVLPPDDPLDIITD